MNTPLETSLTLGEIVTLVPGAAATFEKLGLDYCCKGRRSLASACAERDLDPQEVLTEITKPATATPPARRWEDASMSELADHIEGTYHASARRLIARLQELAAKVAAVHATRHPELEELRELVGHLADDMHEHMIREERVLFPWLRRLETPSEITSGPPWSVKRPISCMEHDHDDVGALLERIRHITGNLTPPAEACASWRGLYALLREFELETHQHIHLENNILFPAGIRAEAVREATA